MRAETISVSSAPQHGNGAYAAAAKSQEEFRQNFVRIRTSTLLPPPTLELVDISEYSIRWYGLRTRPALNDDRVTANLTRHC